jgi:hypothetical protein
MYLEKSQSYLVLTSNNEPSPGIWIHYICDNKEKNK